MMKKALSLLLVTLVLATVTGLVLAQYNSRGLPDFTSLIKDNKAAVVNIAAMQNAGGNNQQQFGGFFDDYFRGFGPPGAPPFRRREESLGSGFIISPDGYVLTNSHVVKNADQIVVRLSNRSEYQAKVVGTDARSDIALLKIEATDLPHVRLGRSKDVEVGEWVLAIGSPFGFDYTVTSGIISALHRSLPTERNENYVPFIQTDVAINPGNSGGPLFNLNGEVIGINAQIYTRTGSYIGVSFAIPIDVAMEVADQLKESGEVKRGWLGVVIQEVDLNLAESFGLSRPQGALVSRVVDDSPADQYGILSGDIILKLNDQIIDTSGELPQVVGRIRPGTDINLDVMRDKSKIRLQVKLGELPSRQDDAIARGGGKKPQDGESGLHSEKLGIHTAEAPDSIAEMLKNSGFNYGVFVDRVSEGPASDAGIRRGDVLLSINNKQVSSSADLEGMLSGFVTGDVVPVHIFRRANQLYVALRIAGTDNN